VKKREIGDTGVFSSRVVDVMVWAKTNLETIPTTLVGYFTFLLKIVNTWISKKS